MTFTTKSLSVAGASLLMLALLLSPHAVGSAAVNSDEQAKKAAERASNAVNILEAVAGDKGIPRELLDEAQAVAVFPHLVKTKLLIEQLSVSLGVVSTRLPTGWSYPAYYGFVGAGFEFNVPGKESADVVMLFMNKEAAGWFQKGRFELGGEKKAVKGEVGALTDEQRAGLAKANVILYTSVGGEVSGKGFDSNFFNSFGVGPDNKLNKAVYGVKSSEILAGKQPTTNSLPQGVTDFRAAISRLLPQKDAGGG